MDLRTKQVSSPYPLRILILEDLSPQIDLITSLSSIPFPIETKIVHTKQSFVSMLFHFVPQMILADMEGKYFSGVQALTLVRRIFPDIPVILLADHMTVSQRLHLLADGATDILDKCNLGEIKSSIDMARRLHSDSESQLLNLNVMNQIRKNIEALTEIRNSLCTDSHLHDQNPSKSIVNELDESISYLQHLGESLRKEAAGS